MAKITTDFEITKDNFVSTDLKVGEMMQLDWQETPANNIIMRTYDEYVLLNNSYIVWDKKARLYGRKLLSGESVTLTQE